MEHMNINNFNTWAKNHIFDENKFDDDGYIIMENDSNFKSTGIISKIFEDHWHSFYSKYKKIIDTKRPNASKEINKIINCSNHKLGVSVFVCPNDDEVYFCHHTFGRPLNFNSHIHVIIAEGLIDKIHNFKKYNYFNYDALSKRFMKIFLDKMESYFGKDQLKDIKNKMYLKYPNGFYVNNKLEDDSYKFNSIEDLIRYVTRYCSRTVIAESRIINYDGTNVTWFYSDHTHEQYHEVTESAFSFISKLLRHLLPSNFKSIRYYGFYNKSASLCDKLILLVKKRKKKFYAFFT